MSTPTRIPNIDDDAERDLRAACAATLRRVRDLAHNFDATIPYPNTTYVDPYAGTDPYANNDDA